MKFRNQSRYKNNQITNVIDKPILYKKGKRWITIGLSTLLLAGLGAITTVGNNTHADATNTKNNLNQSLNNNSNTNNSISSTKKTESNLSTTNITNEASKLHSKILSQNAMYQNKPVGLSKMTQISRDSNKRSLNSSINNNNQATQNNDREPQKARNPTERHQINNNIYHSNSSNKTYKNNNNTNINNKNQSILSNDRNEFKQIKDEPDSSTTNVNIQYKNVQNNNIIGNQNITANGILNENVNITKQLQIPINYERTSDNKVSTPITDWWPIDVKTGFTAQPAKSTDISKIPGMHAYLSNDGKTLTMTGNMKSYNSDGLDNNYNQDQRLSRITTLNLGNVTNLTTMFGLFENFTSLKTINQVGNWDTSNVSDMGWTFGADANLTNIKALGNWDTSNVTNTGGMFNGATNLSDLQPLSNWNTSRLKSMFSMFKSTHLTNLQPLSNWNTSKVINMSSTFSNDIHLANLQLLSNWNTSNVTSTSGMFGGDNQITNIQPLSNWNLGNWDTSDAPLTFMTGMFGADYKLINTEPLQGWNINSNGTPNATVSNSNGGVQQPGNPKIYNQDTTDAHFTYVNANNYNDILGHGIRTGFNGSIFKVGTNPENIPAGYIAQNPNQQVTYGSSAIVPIVPIPQVTNPITINVNPKTMTVTGHINLICNYNELSDKHPNHIIHTNSISKQIPINNTIGNTIIIHPSNYEKDNYNDNNSIQTIPLTWDNLFKSNNTSILPNKDSNDNVSNYNPTITFNYNAPTTTIDITYIDIDKNATPDLQFSKRTIANHPIVGYQQISDIGPIGTTVELTPQGSNIGKAVLNIPNGFHIQYLRNNRLITNNTNLHNSIMAKVHLVGDKVHLMLLLNNHHSKATIKLQNHTNNKPITPIQHNKKHSKVINFSTNEFNTLSKPTIIPPKIPTININKKIKTVITPLSTKIKHNNQLITKLNNIKHKQGIMKQIYVYSPTTIILHNHHKSIRISKNKGFTGRIIRTTTFHDKRAYIITWHHKHFMLNAKKVQNAYIQPKEFKHHNHGIIKHITIQLRKNANEYNSIHFTKKHCKKHIKASKKLIVIGIKYFGKKHENRTRLILSNGLIITANKNYVKII